MEADTFVKQCREEISENFVQLSKFSENSDLQEVFQRIAAYSARASYMAAQCRKSKDPKVQQFHENELRVFIDELRFQFQAYSRILTTQQFEYDMSKG